MVEVERDAQLGLVVGAAREGELAAARQRRARREEAQARRRPSPRRARAARSSATARPRRASAPTASSRRSVPSGRTTSSPAHRRGEPGQRRHGARRAHVLDDEAERGVPAGARRGREIEGVRAARTASPRRGPTTRPAPRTCPRRERVAELHRRVVVDAQPRRRGDVRERRAEAAVREDRRRREEPGAAARRAAPRRPRIGGEREPARGQQRRAARGSPGRPSGRRRRRARPSATWTPRVGRASGSAVCARAAPPPSEPRDERRRQREQTPGRVS